MNVYVDIMKRAAGITRFFILITLGLFFIGAHAPEPQAKTIIADMLKAIDGIRSLRYTLKFTERIKGKVKNSESHIKLQTSPRKIYMSLNGPELLWIEGSNNGMALVNPNAFPYFNLNLDPSGSLLRTDQHHTIHEIGFDYMADILDYEAKKAGEKFDKIFVYTGDGSINGRNCYKVTINNPDFTFINYTIKKGENIITIARKQRLSEYMILENNPGIKDYTSVKEGTQIKIPSSYAKFTTLFIDKQNLLPIGNKILDDKGVFELYEYHNLQLNPKIAPEEFTKDYKDYKF